MHWLAWSLMLASAATAGATHLLRPAKPPTPGRVAATICSLLLAVASAVLASIAQLSGSPGGIPVVLVVVASMCFAVANGSPYTELVFHLAANQSARRSSEPSVDSPLRGGLWIGLLERAAIASTLWASWPEGIAIVLAIKGLGRFSELKNPKAAEQFILGTFSSVLCAAAAYGLGRLLLG